jgi:hypothetical protein
MKKSLFVFLTVLLPSFIFSQDFQVSILDSFDLKLPGLLYLAYENDTLYAYDSTRNTIYSIDNNGSYLDSIAIDQKINGFDVYQDTLFLQKQGINNQETIILKTNKGTLDIYDSIVWVMENIDLSEFLAITEFSFVSYIYAGWSSGLVRINKTGNVINSAFVPGIGGGPSGISGSSFDKVFYLGDNGYCYEYDTADYGVTINPLFGIIPIESPRGIACIDENSFYTYSKASEKMYKVRIETITGNINYSVHSEKVTIYPNPSSDGYVKIQSEIPIEKTEILTLDGQMVQSINGNRHFIDVANYIPRTYILILYCSKGAIFKKLIIN